MDREFRSFAYFRERVHNQLREARKVKLYRETCSIQLQFQSLAGNSRDGTVMGGREEVSLQMPLPNCSDAGFMHVLCCHVTLHQSPCASV